MKQVEKYMQELQKINSKSKAILIKYMNSFDSPSSFRDFVSLIHNCYLEASRTIDYIDNISKSLDKEEKDDLYRTQRDYWKNEVQSDSQLFSFSSASLNNIAEVLFAWKDDSDMLRMASDAAINLIVLEMIREKLTLLKIRVNAVHKSGRPEDNKNFNAYVAKGVDGEKAKKCLHNIIDGMTDKSEAMCVIVAAIRAEIIDDMPSTTMIRYEFPNIICKSDGSNEGNTKQNTDTKRANRYLKKLPNNKENQCNKYKEKLLSIME